MKLDRDLFLELLRDQSTLTQYKPSELSYLYIKTVLTGVVSLFIEEQYWLVSQRKEISFEDYINEQMSECLEPIPFAKSLIIETQSRGLKKLRKKVYQLENAIIMAIKDHDSIEQISFLRLTLLEMLELFVFEEQNEKSARLYRAFDSLDALFNFDYSKDRSICIRQSEKDSNERLYIGSGVGVQSGYSNILLAYKYLNLKDGDKIIDLGSGYGRVGLVFSLLNNKLNFKGYEFIEKRVDISNAASKFFNLDRKLEYITQDLSEASFEVPICDVYYLYDPFTEETYKFILEQILEISKKKTVSIVTKGNANKWLRKIADAHSWPSPLELDNSNLCVFKN